MMILFRLFHYWHYDYFRCRNIAAAISYITPMIIFIITLRRIDIISPRLLLNYAYCCRLLLLCWLCQDSLLQPWRLLLRRLLGYFAIFIFQLSLHFFHYCRWWGDYFRHFSSDYYYIDAISLSLDMKMICRLPFAMNYFLHYYDYADMVKMHYIDYVISYWCRWLRRNIFIFHYAYDVYVRLFSFHFNIIISFDSDCEY